MDERRCEDCPARARDGGTRTEGERAAEARASMPVLYDMAIRSCVKAAEVLGFVDERWDDPQALRQLIFDARDFLSEGIRTVRESE